MRFEQPSAPSSIPRALAACALATLAGSLAAQDDSSAADLRAWEAMNARVLGLYQAGQVPAATEEARYALEFARSALGEEHPNTLLSTAHLARLFTEIGAYDDGDSLLEKCDAARPRMLASEPSIALEFLSVVAGTRQAQGRLLDAEILARQTLEGRIRLHGEEDSRTLESLCSLASICLELGRASEAEPLAERCLESSRKALGADHSVTRSSRECLGRIQESLGRFADAEETYAACRQTEVRVAGTESLGALRASAALARVYFRQGRYGESEAEHEKTIEVMRQVLGEDHAQTTLALWNLGELLHAQARREEAERLFDECSTAFTRTLGPHHPRTILALRRRGMALAQHGRPQEGERILQKCLESLVRSLGPDHPTTLSSQEQIALTWYWNGRREEGMRLEEECLEARTRALGADHVDTLRGAAMLASLHFYSGRYEDAERYSRRCMDGVRRALPEGHPLGPLYAKTLGASLVMQGKDAEAADAFLEAARRQETWLREVLPSLPPAGRPGVLQARDSAVAQLHVHCPLLSLAAGSRGDARSAQMALEIVLWHKGILTRVAADLEHLSRLRSSTETSIADELARLDETRRRLATLWLAAPPDDPSGWAERGESIARLRVERDQIEKGLALEIGQKPLGTTRGREALAALQGLLGSDHALVEFVAFHAHSVSGSTREEPVEHFAALVLPGGPNEEVQAIDLGTTSDIAREIEKFRRVVRDPAGVANPLVASRARELHARLWQPLASALEGARKVYISPDGAIHLVPFEALRTPEGRFLVEQIELVRVPGGLDLIDQESDTAGRGALILADAEYGGRDQSGSFARLPGAAAEGEAIALVLSESGVSPVERLAGPGATETELRRKCQATAPAILHMATHGFFVELAGAEALVRSGVALAGANDPPGAAGDDGKLTALEALGLPLDGTDLVVLSACETGVGEVTSGEGVGSLAAAFRHAGARQVFLTLWPVADDSTREFMVAFYRRYLEAGDARAALRETQLEFLASEDRARAAPATWGGFALVGGK